MNYPVAKSDIDRFMDINEIFMEKTAHDEPDNNKIFKELTLTQTRAVRLIHFHRPCMMSKLAKSMGLTLGTVTTMIDKLIDKKFVKRVRSEKDNRIVHALLTKKGEKVIIASHAHVERMAKTILSKLTMDEQKQFLFLFEKTIGIL